MDTMTAFATCADHSRCALGAALFLLAGTMLLSCSDGRAQATGDLVASAQAAHSADQSFTAAEPGFYVIDRSEIRVADRHPGEVVLRVFVKHARTDDSLQPLVITRLDAGDYFTFDAFVGYLAAGDAVLVETNTATASEDVQLRWNVRKTDAIPVSVFPEDVSRPANLDAPGGWSLMPSVVAGDPAARLLGWESTGGAAHEAFSIADSHARISLESAHGEARESIAAFRVPHSGYYALHNSSAAAGRQPARARVYVGDARMPLIDRVLTPASVTPIDTDLGYIEKGDVVYVAFASRQPTSVEFAADIIEWAPRRAPLRVRRGSDGYFDVYEPADQRRAIDIPADRWVTVPAQDGDATEAIRAAFSQARSLQQGDEYAGVRLESSKRYAIASTQDSGIIFEIKEARRLVFDGNGSTLFVNSPEAQRAGIRLFTTSDSRSIALADFAVETNNQAFSVGEILAVSPMDRGNQTVTFRPELGAADPLADIRRDGNGEGYAYDPHIPGRPAYGTWSHYPGGNSKPQIVAGEEPGVFDHTVTRTNQSIPVGAKWLVKNKRGGVHYLSTGGGSEDITLSGVIGRASAAGMLTFWQCSGVSILDCRFEPQDQAWISSTSDGVHGRGREGVWIENTLIRGICEDVMNTYGMSMVVVPDDQPDDNALTLGMFDAGRRDRDGNFVLGKATTDHVRPGDDLTFYNPADGRVLGYATVREFEDGRAVLSNPVPGIDTWEKTDGKAATMVYNNNLAARFFVRDSRFMDSMRFGIFIKARGGAVFNTHFEGLASHAIFAANEPEWPEGPPPTHLWLQGNTFYQNDFGYCGRNRAFLTVDPAQVSIYTRRLRDPAATPGDFRGHLTRGQYPCAHMKIVGNTFADWAGMGIAVRNSRNLHITDNLFLPPAEDQVTRATLAKDPSMSNGDEGRYAAIFLDSVSGGQVRNNRFVGLPAGDHAIVQDQLVRDVAADRNALLPDSLTDPLVALSFSEWFGANSEEAAGLGAARDHAELRGARHRAGRLGAGLSFEDPADHVVVPASADLLGTSTGAFTLALWVCPADSSSREQVIFGQADARRGVVIAIVDGRYVAGLWQEQQGGWVDLGPAIPGLWRHLALSYDAGELRGFVDALAVSSAIEGLPSRLGPIGADASLGRAISPVRLSARHTPAAGLPFAGMIDELRLYGRSLAEHEIAVLAMRQPGAR